MQYGDVENARSRQKAVKPRAPLPDGNAAPAADASSRGPASRLTRGWFQVVIEPMAVQVEEQTQWRRWALGLLAAGALLRGLLIYFPRSGDDDTDVYAELGRNLLHHGTYGMMADGDLSPSLFRLPGYPLFLALLGGKIWLALLVQSAIDLLGCYLLALFVRRYVSQRAGLWTLALSATCWFTAEYAASALTESLSVFAVCWAIHALGEFLAQPRAFDSAPAQAARRLLPLAGAAAMAMLLRPDGALLTFSAGFALLWYGVRAAGAVRALKTAVLFAALAAVPLVPWTLRNAITFHVFQPLAPRHVNDPGERVNLGFYRWMRTWSTDLESTGDVFWKVGTEPIDFSDLPKRACDSAEECEATARLLAEYNTTKQVDQPLDDKFAALAEARIRAHPLRYYVAIPLLRVGDMWLRPRTDAMQIEAAWWRWDEHPKESAIAVALGLLNLAYVVAACVGVARCRVPLLPLMASYFAMRCLLLATIENSEPRYTLEAYPIVLVCAAVALSGERLRHPARPPIA